MATAPSTAPAPTAVQNPAQAAPAVPFRVGTQNWTNLDGYTQTNTLTTSAIPLPNYQPSINNYLRGIWIDVTATTASNAATVAYQGDGPFSVIQSLAFLDTQQRPIIQLTGYQLAQIVNKHGGYFENGDPRADATFTATTGSGGTGGSFHFTAWIPLEINNRTGMGSVLNQNSAQTWTLQVTLAPIASVYSTAPTNPASVTVVAFEDGWWPALESDSSGPIAQAPSAPNTYSYWLMQPVGGGGAINGAVQAQLPNGLGASIRMIAFQSVDAGNSTRATGDTDFPTTLQLLYKGQNLMNISKTLWKSKMSKNYGFTSATADTANGLENGVYVLYQFMQDFGFKPGDGKNFALLDTDQGDQFQFVGTMNGSANVYELVNYIIPGSGNFADLRIQQ